MNKFIIITKKNYDEDCIASSRYDRFILRRQRLPIEVLRIFARHHLRKMAGGRRLAVGGSRDPLVGWASQSRIQLVLEHCVGSGRRLHESLPLLLRHHQ